MTYATELIVSELVTNAIRYGGSPITLRLIQDRTLICEVSDSSSTAPHLRRAPTFDEGGRGLMLVAQMAQRWGTRHIPTGKTIWAEQSLVPRKCTTALVSVSGGRRAAEPEQREVDVPRGPLFLALPSSNDQVLHKLHVPAVSALGRGQGEAQ